MRRRQSLYAFRGIRPVREFPARHWAFAVFCPDWLPDSYRDYETVSNYQAAVNVKEAEGLVLHVAEEGLALRAAEAKCHNREHSNLQDTYQA